MRLLRGIWEVLLALYGALVEGREPVELEGREWYDL